MAEPEDSKNESKEQKNEVHEIIDEYTKRIRAIRRCAQEHIQHAFEKIVIRVEAFAKQISEFARRKKAGEELHSLIISREFCDELQIFAEHTSPPHSEILAQSLLIFGFSAFDAFFGNLLRCLYHKDPTFIPKLGGKAFRVSDLLECGSVEDARNIIIDRDVSSLLRKSYTDVFSRLATRHDLSTLAQFGSWPAFVEASQRRNLITHCNGIVNSQYINACKAAGYKLDEKVKAGIKLLVDPDYLRQTLDVLYEVGVMLGYTLWRKSFPEATLEADDHLSMEVFHILSREEWKLAQVLADFAVRLPKQKSDKIRQINRLNLSQSLKWAGDNDRAMKVLDAYDWSGSTRDMRLGVAVLQGKYDIAAEFMIDIGKNGETVRESGYASWPIFREFRNTEQFRSAFQTVYGKPFAEFKLASEPEKSQNSPDTTKSTSCTEGDSPMPTRPDDIIDQSDDTDAESTGK